MKRNNILKKILNIESRINTIKSDSTYLTIKRNLSYLENARFGPSVVSIASPDDVNESLIIKRHSQEFKDTLSKYGKKKSEFEQRIDDLNAQRTELIGQLFPNQL